jgi:hypothetical protein
VILTESDSPDDHRRINRLIAKSLSDDIDMFQNIPAWMFQERFPEWLTIDQSQFEGILRRLQLMASDPFDHELTPLLEWVLYHSLCEWLEFAEECEAEEDDPELVAEYRRKIDDINLAIDVVSDWDVLMLPMLVKGLQLGGGLLGELGVNLGDYVDILPEDVRVRVEAQLKAKAEQNEKDGACPPNPPT